MGLSITYTLSAPAKLQEFAVREMTERTEEFARKIGCRIACPPNDGGPDHWKMWDLPDGSSTGEPVPPLNGWSLIVDPGEGCEPAFFGLCRYREIDHWKLDWGCKTQYASRHGLDHFLLCHRRIISLLDLWRDFGVKVEVMDEGEYWETRSVERLKERIALYDRMVAAMAGTLKDALGDGITGEIFDDARFEHLEAEGRKQFAKQLEEASARVKKEIDQNEQ